MKRDIFREGLQQLVGEILVGDLGLGSK